MHEAPDWDAAVERARAALGRLSRDDKLAIALGDFERVTDEDVVPFRYTDGPNGAREVPGATAFPSSLALAASFDRALAKAYGTALALEVRGGGKTALLGPAFDIARVPHSGRAGESYGEDPVLAGEVGGAVVQAVQTAGVLAVVKHYVANNVEWLRTGSGFPDRGPAQDAHVDPAALTDLYLEPFRRVLGRFGAGAVMGSYNRLNGEYTCQSPDLLDLPRREWGWRGASVPDFMFAVREPRAALEAGLDLPGLDGAAGRTAEDLLEGGDAGLERLDRIVLHVLTAAEIAGMTISTADDEQIAHPETLAVAERVAADGMVLLQNDDVLPLAADASVAVIDAAAADALLVIGGSAAVPPTFDRVRRLDDVLPGALPSGRVVGVEALGGDVPLPLLEGAVSATVRGADGAERTLVLDRFALAGLGPTWAASVRTELTPAASGPHSFTLEFAGVASLLVDGEQVARGFREASPFVVGPVYPLHAVVELEAGRAVEVRVEYETGVAIDVPIPDLPVHPHLELGHREPDDRVERAAAAAAEADVAVVLVGRVSGEGMDVESLRLPGRQDELVQAVAAANPRTVVVTLGSTPLVLPWRTDVAAVLHAWFPGERFAEALAAVLTGAAEPGGRLPITWPAAEDRTPIQDERQYPGVDGVLEYSEGLLVGYRWYDAMDEQPAFPFGHGLGYTTFEVGAPSVDVQGERMQVAAPVRNTGDRAGKAVLQVYVTYPAGAAQPPRLLKGFAAVRMEAGEEREVAVEVLVDDLACADSDGRRRVLPGRYEVAVGLSSRDLGAAVPVDVPDAATARAS